MMINYELRLFILKFYVLTFYRFNALLAKK